MTDTPDPVRDETRHEAVKPHRFRWLRNRFLTGLIVALPIFVTISAISWIVGKVDTYVINLLPLTWKVNPWVDLVLGIPGLGLIVVMVSLVILGTFASNFIGTSVIKAG